MQLQAHSAAPPADDFNDLLIDQFRKTPWYLISAAIHAVVFMAVIWLSTERVQAELPEQLAVVIDDEEIQEEIPEEDEPEIVDPITPQDEDVEIAEVSENDDIDSDVAEDMGEAEDVGDEGLVSHDASVIGPAGGDLGGGMGSGNGHGFGKRGKRPPHEKTLYRAFDWLKRHQHLDGRWDGDDFRAAKGEPHADKCACCRESKAAPLHDVGLTGLALLAYLGAGETHKAGNYRKTVRRGLAWLKSQQNAEGRFGGQQHGFTYDHAIASLAMIEAYGMTRSPLFKRPAQQALAYCLACQTPYAGWRYEEDGSDTDTSVTGWMVMALKSARLAGLEVDQRNFQWALDWVEKMTDEETGRTGYVKPGAVTVREKNLLEEFPGSESEAMTAAGILVRVFAGQDPQEEPMIRLGSESVLAECLPVWDLSRGSIDMYYWYYGTLAMFQVGGKSWRIWNRTMKPAIVETQRTEGCASGSWDPVGAWGGQGGRIYSTALMALCLEVYYRYDRVFGTR